MIVGCGVATRTVCKPRMTDPRSAPPLGAVAIGALTAVVIILLMAASTICQALVAEINLLPIFGGMTV